MFNIVLKLNNHVWKKLQNYFFMEKNEVQTSGFVVAKKLPSLKKKIFWKKKKKILPAYLCGYDLQNRVRNFFKMVIEMFKFHTMCPSYRIAITPFQFSYRIGLLFSLERIFFGMILITESVSNAAIQKVIRDVSDSYLSAPKTQWKHMER